MISAPFRLFSRPNTLNAMDNNKPGKEEISVIGPYGHWAGAGDSYKCSFYPGPHKFDIQMQLEAFDWFDQWLKT